MHMCMLWRLTYSNILMKNIILSPKPMLNLSFVFKFLLYKFLRNMLGLTNESSATAWTGSEFHARIQVSDSWKWKGPPSYRIHVWERTDERIIFQSISSQGMSCFKTNCLMSSYMEVHLPLVLISITSVTCIDVASVSLFFQTLNQTLFHFISLD